MFSSAGEVSSTKRTFLPFSLNIQISGRLLVLAMHGGTWYCDCLVSQSIFQSSNDSQNVCLFRFIDFVGLTPFLTNLMMFASELHFDFLFSTRLSLINFTMADKIESCLQLIRPWSNETLHEQRMCWSVHDFQLQSRHFAS